MWMVVDLYNKEFFKFETEKEAYDLLEVKMNHLHEESVKIDQWLPGGDCLYVCQVKSKTAYVTVGIIDEEWDEWELVVQHSDGTTTKHTPPPPTTTTQIKTTQTKSNKVKVLDLDEAFEEISLFCEEEAKRLEINGPDCSEHFEIWVKEGKPNFVDTDWSRDMFIVKVREFLEEGKINTETADQLTAKAYRITFT